MNAPRRPFFQTAVVVSAALHAVALALPAPASTPARPAEIVPASPAPRLSARLLAAMPARPATSATLPAPRATLRPPLDEHARPHAAPTPTPSKAAGSALPPPTASPAAPADIASAAPTATTASPPAMRASDHAAVPGEAPTVVETAPEHRADYLDNPKPVYPKFARDRGQQGRVLLAVHVGADGRPTAVRLERSSGFPLLDAAAQDAVERWRFVPARRGATAIAAWAQVPIAFGLSQP